MAVTRRAQPFKMRRCILLLLLGTQHSSLVMSSSFVTTSRVPTSGRKPTHLPQRLPEPLKFQSKLDDVAGTSVVKRPPTGLPLVHHHSAAIRRSHSYLASLANGAVGETAQTVVKQVAKSVHVPPSALSKVLNFLFAFTLGGLFFSTALTAFFSFAAVGQENMRRVFSLFRVVLENVWTVFWQGLRETRRMLVDTADTVAHGSMNLDNVTLTGVHFGGNQTNEIQPSPRRKLKWRQAWNELKVQWNNTRQAAAEGVEAIRLEAGMYSAAVGSPGLIPLQYALDRFTPYSVQTVLQNALEDVLENIHNDNIRKISLVSFSVGSVSPKLLGARIYNVGEDAIAFDVDMIWNSLMKFRLDVLTKRLGLHIPCDISGIIFDGCLRVQLTPLHEHPPGFGAALVSFPKVPKIAMNITMAGAQISKVPWFESEINKEIQKAIQNELLWPKRTVVPTLVPKTKKMLLEPSVVEALKHDFADPLSITEMKIKENQLIRRDLQSYAVNPEDMDTVLDMVVANKIFSAETSDDNKEDEGRTDELVPPSPASFLGRLAQRVKRRFKKVERDVKNQIESDNPLGE